MKNLSFQNPRPEPEQIQDINTISVHSKYHVQVSFSINHQGIIVMKQPNELLKIFKNYDYEYNK